MPGLVAAFGPGAADPREVLRAARRLSSRGAELRLEGAGAAIAVVGAASVAVHAGWTVAVVGELENLRQLRTELGGTGLPAEASPAEVVGLMISEIGVERALLRLEGSLGVVAWDGATLWIARDKTGLRSLYVLPGPTVRVATELAALPTAEARREDLQQFVIHGLFSPPRGLVEGVRAVAPGTLLRLDPTPTELRWFTPGMNPAGSEGNRAKWAGAVGNAVRLAAIRAFDDGAVLADGGGAASTLLAAQLPGKIRRLSLGEGPGERLRWDAEVFGATALDLPMTTPIGDPGVVAWAWLAQRAADLGAPALVTGHGAVELFGDRRVGLRAAVARLRAAGDVRLPEEAALPVDAELDALRAAAPTGPERAVDAWVQRAGVLPERELRAVDAAAGAAGLKGRAPFAGAIVSEVVAQVPFGLVAPSLRGEPLLTSLSGVVGGHRPFTFPVGAWGIQAGLFTERLAEDLEGWVESDHVRALLTAQAAGVDHGARLWRLWALARWRAAR